MPIAAIRSTKSILPSSNGLSPNLITRRELVSEQIRSLSSSTSHLEDGDVSDSLHRDMDACFNAFKSGVEGVLGVAGKVPRGSKLHNNLRLSVGALIGRLAEAFDLEIPSRDFTADNDDDNNRGSMAEGGSHLTSELSRDSPGNAEGATAVSVASQFAAALPDDPAAQIEAFRIILNQLKQRNRQL